MPTLKDYLGSLVKDLNHARVIADIESASIAEMYAEHHLLKHFSIPRMKILETELTIPISIDDLENSIEKDYQPIKNTEFYAQAYSEIKNVFQVSSFSREVSSSLKKVIFSEIDTLEKEVKSSGDIQTSLSAFCDKVSDISLSTIKKDKRGAALFTKARETSGADSDQIKEILAVNLAKYLRPKIRSREISGKIENANVTVESDKLKDKRPDSLLYIKMKISEESMEWQTIEDGNGNVVTKLMVE